MPVPIFPLILGAGVGALLLAGSSEAKAGTGGTATGATQSTGGPQGGATTPSRSDYSGQPISDALPDQSPGMGTGPSGAGGSVEVDATQGTAQPTGDNRNLSSAGTMTAGGGKTSSTGLAEGLYSGYTDPWANAAPNDPNKPLQSIGVVAGQTAKDVSNTFQNVASNFGFVW